MSAVFEDPLEAIKYSCDKDDLVDCDIYESSIYLDEYLVPTLLNMIIEVLQPSLYKPEDKSNNADDDLSNVNYTK